MRAWEEEEVKRRRRRGTAPRDKRSGMENFVRGRHPCNMPVCTTIKYIHRRALHPHAIRTHLSTRRSTYIHDGLLDHHPTASKSLYHSC